MAEPNIPEVTAPTVVVNAPDAPEKAPQVWRGVDAQGGRHEVEFPAEYSEAQVRDIFRKNNYKADSLQIISPAPSAPPTPVEQAQGEADRAQQTQQDNAAKDANVGRQLGLGARNLATGLASPVSAVADVGSAAINDATRVYNWGA